MMSSWPPISSITARRSSGRDASPRNIRQREIASPQLERRGVAPARLACVAQPVIVPAAVPKPHQADLEQADGTVAKRLEKLGIDPCVVMPAAAGAFVGAVTIGQRREQIGAGVELRRQESQPPGGTIRPWLEFHGGLLPVSPPASSAPPASSSAQFALRWRSASDLSSSRTMHPPPSSRPRLAGQQSPIRLPVARIVICMLPSE